MSSINIDMLTQAAQWYATLRSEDATEADQQAWQTWLRQRPAHAAAWQHIEAVSRKFDPLRAAGAQQAARAGLTAAMGRRRAMGGIASVAGAGLLAWLGWRQASSPWLAALAADYRTGIGEQDTLALADGSTVWMNTGSALDVDYDPTVRKIKLLAGEILVQTAKDAARPFYVATRYGCMQALGTRFSVRLLDDGVRLDVFEGAVLAVNSAGASRRVEAGQHVRLDAATISEAGPADQAREAWSRGVVLADNIPLRSLVDELKRYRRGHIDLAPEVADLNTMGVYPANDTDRALAMLAQSLPVRVRHLLPWWTAIDADPAIRR